MDEQDPANPFKPFPIDGYEYHRFLTDRWAEERILFIEKSRTMMTSWWMAGVCTHYVQTHAGMSCIYWAHEEKPAVKLIDYSKTLWQQQDDDLKRLYPLTTPDTARQPYNRMEYKHGGWLLALPGKDPGKIRSEHPTIVAFDEAAHIPNFADAFSVALLTKVPKMLAVSTSFPGDFCDMIEQAQDEA